MVAMSARLWLVRHGATDWSDASRLNGWTDVPLNDRGRLQARSLAGQLNGRSLAGVWSSDLARTEETARLALREPVVDSRLRELDFGTLEGSRWEEVPVEFQRAMAAFDGFRAPGGESVAELRSRVTRFVEGLPSGDHALFTHGGVIRLFLRATGPDRRVLPGQFAVLTREALLEGESIRRGRT
jgi:2,3-bisphosphoglycerate-dependent phosphoglycerate mutase